MTEYIGVKHAVAFNSRTSALHLLVCALGLFLACALSLLWAGRFLIEDDVLSEVDVIMVLGGDPAVRLPHGVRLFEEEYADRIVLSGGQRYGVGLVCSSAELALEDAEALGLPSGAAILAPEAQSTHDEALNLRALAAEHGWRSLIVVTSPSHTRRAGRTFRTLLPGVAITVSAAPDPRYDPVRWWSNEHSFTEVVNEVVKLAYYWVHHGIRPLLLNPYQETHP